MNPTECIVCGEASDESDNRLVHESPVNPGLKVHFRCQMTQEYRHWVERQKAENERYRRYVELMTMGRRIECPNCGTTQGISPKAVGMGAGHWEVNCIRCYRTCPEDLSGYDKRTRAAYRLLSQARQSFLATLELPSVEAEVRSIAAKADRRFKGYVCLCGGRFSLAAMPRCIQCLEVVEETYFNYAFEPSAV